MANTPAETSIPIGEWSIGSLKAHHDMMITYERQISDERDKRYHERWRAQEKASERYQEVSNEFRGSLDDLSSKMATKLELVTAVASISEKIDVLRQDLTNTNSRLDVGNPDVRSLQTQAATNFGINQGSQITKSDIYRAVGMGISILGAIMLMINYLQ